MCYILATMRKPIHWLTAGAALFGLCFAQPRPAVPAQTAEPAPQGTHSFHLVYESDTRGYYRPCG